MGSVSLALETIETNINEADVCDFGCGALWTLTMLGNYFILLFLFYYLFYYYF